VDLPNIVVGGKVDANSSSTWTDVFPSHEVIQQEVPDVGAVTCKEEANLVLTSNGADGGGGAVVFPLVLNVVDDSGKEVVAVVSVGGVPPPVTEPENTLTESTYGKVLPQNEPFTCGDCGQVFSNIIPFEKHCLEHNNSEPFKCTNCTRRFKRRQDLDRHKVSHPNVAFSCTTCFAKFSDQEALSNHYKIHNPPLPEPCQESDNFEMVCKVETFQCSQCDRSFNDANLLQHHEFTHSEGELYPCDQCGRTFREESRLVTHLKLHKKNQKCGKCNEIFTNMFDFNEHMIAHKFEDSKEDYKCLHCKVSFNSFERLKKHVSSHGMEVHWCGDCGGSGHVGLSLGHMKVADPNLVPEKEMIVIAKTESLCKEEDPIRYEMSNAVTACHEDDDLIKSEGNSFDEEEAEISEFIKFGEKPGKRKLTGPQSGAFNEISPGSQRKSARKK